MSSRKQRCALHSSVAFLSENKCRQPDAAEPLPKALNPLHAGVDDDIVHRKRRFIWIEHRNTWVHTAIYSPDLEQRTVRSNGLVEYVKIRTIQVNHDIEEAFFALARMNSDHKLPGSYREGLLNFLEFFQG